MQKRDYIRKKLHKVQKINRENALEPYGQRTSSFPGTLVATAQACGMTVGHSAPALGGNLDAGSVAGSRSAARCPTPSLDVACHALAHQLHRERLFLMSCPARFHGNSGIKKRPVLLQHKAFFHNFLSIFG